MLILVLVGWERSPSITSRFIHDTGKFCKMFSMTTLLVLYIGQVDLVNWLPENMRIISGLGTIKEIKVDLFIRR
jgi:hypothetical protein